MGTAVSLSHRKNPKHPNYAHGSMTNQHTGNEVNEGRNVIWHQNHPFPPKFCTSAKRKSKRFLFFFIFPFFILCWKRKIRFMQTNTQNPKLSLSHSHFTELFRFLSQLFQTLSRALFSERIEHLWVGTSILCVCWFCILVSCRKRLASLSRFRHRFSYTFNSPFCISHSHFPLLCVFQGLGFRVQLSEWDAQSARAHIFRFRGEKEVEMLRFIFVFCVCFYYYYYYGRILVWPALFSSKVIILGEIFKDIAHFLRLSFFVLFSRTPQLPVALFLKFFFPEFII